MPGGVAPAVATAASLLAAKLRMPAARQERGREVVGQKQARGGDRRLLPPLTRQWLALAKGDADGCCQAAVQGRRRRGSRAGGQRRPAGLLVGACKGAVGRDTGSGRLAGAQGRGGHPLLRRRLLRLLLLLLLLGWPACLVLVRFYRCYGRALLRHGHPRLHYRQPLTKVGNRPLQRRGGEAFVSLTPVGVGTRAS